MAKYRKRSEVVIEAVVFLSIAANGVPMFVNENEGAPDWLRDALRDGTVRPTKHGGQLFVKTLEGMTVASPGDWIVRGVMGEIYPCRDDIFEATYDPAEAP